MTDTTKPSEHPPLPEPKYIYHQEDEQGSGDLFLFSESGAVDAHCETCERLFIADQLHAYADPLLDEISALEKLASVGEMQSLQQSYGQVCAENVQLRAKLKALEEQKPVAWRHQYSHGQCKWVYTEQRYKHSQDALYLSAGAKE